MDKRTPLKALAVLAAVAIVAVGGAAVVSARATDEPRYRTAVATTQAVDQVLAAVGTIEPVSQAAVAFPTSGTVASVRVEVGDVVDVGSSLATLDTDDLEVSLHAAQADLDAAELVLQRALDGEDVGSVAGGAPSGGFGRSAGAAADGALAAAQQAVLDAQHAVGEALAAAEAAMAAADDVCGDDSTPTTTVPETTTTTTVADPPTDDADACRTALAAALEAQRTLAAAQAELVDAAGALTDLLDQLGEDPTTTTTTTTTPAPPTTPTAPVTPSVPSGSVGTSPTTEAPTTTTSSPSAEDLIAYQKAVDAAALQVAVAEQAAAQAEIVSPIAGTVVAVGFEAGDEAEAASATQTVVVVGEGGFEVTTKVSVADLPDLEVGQAAVVRPDGSDQEVDGQIVRIGVTPDAASGSSTYAVTIGLTGDTSSLGNGSTASIEIITAATDEALAVPTSAVAVDGDAATVDVVGEDGEASTVDVEVGAVGSVWTEITEGLDDGDVVVLADLDEALPGTATDGSSASSDGGAVTFPGGGQLPGGGFPGGGQFPGGAGPGG